MQAEVDIDDGKGDIRIVLLKTVVDDVEDPEPRDLASRTPRVRRRGFEVGDVMEEPVDFAVFGRAAVQAAKQRIIQRVREGERTRIRDEFATRVGELLSGEVQQIERGKLVVMLNKFREAEAIIPYREQNHREHFHQGEPIRAVLKRVEETPKGPRLILSRGDPLFVKALFKLEVPEIQQNIVEIRAAAREVGSRTKIAVFSRDDSIDPVGACVGLKGSRVQAVVNELGRRAHRHRAVVARSGALRQAGARAGARSRACSAIRRRRRFRRSSTRTSSRWRSAATARTCGSRPSSPAGRSISTRAASGWSAAARAQIFAPLPEESRGRRPTSGSPRSAGMPPATVAVLEEAGYRTLNDIIDLEREDFLKLARHRAGGGRSHHGDDRRADDGRRRRDDEADGRRAARSRVALDDVDASDSSRAPVARVSACAVAVRSSAWSRCGRRRRRTRWCYAVVASDASRNSLDKVVPLLNARRVRFVEVPSAAELGAAVGRESDGGRRHRRSAAREGHSRAGGVGPR